MTPRERWLQRILSAKGVRPVGHAADDEGEGEETVPVAPVIPIQPTAPAPGWPPLATRPVSSMAGPGRLPAPGQTIALGDDEDEGDEGPEVPVEDDVQDDEYPVEDDVQDDEEQEPPAVPPTPTGPAAKVHAGAKPVRKKSAGRAGAKAAKDDPNLRITVFNLSAAAVGYMTPIAAIVETYLLFAEQAARGIFAFALAGAGLVGTWWVTGRPAVRHILTGVPYGFLARPLMSAGVAEIARHQAPRLVAWLNQNGQERGLGPDAVSFLITAGGISFGLWWFIDRKLRRFHWVVRWLFRIPLATAVVVTLRHGSPTH